MKNGFVIFSSLCMFLSGCGRDDNHTYQGYVEGTNIYIASPFSGDVTKQVVSRGQTVKKGDLLFQLDPNPEIMALEQAKASERGAEDLLHDLEKPRRPLEISAIADQVKQVEANLALANLRVKRFEELYQTKVVELDKVDEAVSNQHALQANVSQLQANLDLAKLGSREDQIKAQTAKVTRAKFALKAEQWKLNQKNLSAPADGVIFDTYYQEGEFVEVAKPVAILLPFDTIRIEFFVPARDLANIHLNQTIQFTCAGCAKTNEAVIDFISPEAEFVPPLVYSRDNLDNLVFRVKAPIKHPRSFKPGQPVMVVGFDHAK